MRKNPEGLDQIIAGLDRRTVIVLSLVTAVILGTLDYVTGFEIAFSFFYLIPVGIVTWYIGKKEGIALAFLCSVCWAISNYLAGQTYSHQFVYYWNAVIRFGMFLGVVQILNNLRLSLLQAQTLSCTDFVTGINNGRELYRRADLEILNSNRFGHPLTVVVMDVDGFKQVNDTLGHQKGDELLRIIGQTMLLSIRKTDFVARTGGDEFALLFPGTDPNGAHFIIEKLKDTLVDKMNEMDLEVTFSFGAVTFRAPLAFADAVLNKADKAMYSAKGRGKNQIAYQTIE